MTPRVLRILIGIAAFTTAASVPVWAQPQHQSPFVAEHPVLKASLERLQTGSAAWREAIDILDATGRRAIIATPDEVAIRTAGGAYDFDSESLAGAQPIVDEHARVEIVLVVVNLPLLQRLSSLPMASAEFQDDVDRILAHEVYGHAVPFLIAGDLAGKCADPESGQAAVDACAIKRENVVRKELRLGRRTDYGRESLSLSRRYRQ